MIRLFVLAILVLPSAASAQGALPGARAEGARLYAANELSEAANFLGQVVTANPDDHEAQIWLADALRQWGQESDDYVLTEEAFHQGRKAIAGLSECSSAALTVTAESIDPVLSVWPGADEAQAVAYLNSAVECDPGDGNAWIRVLPHAMRSDSAQARHALERLYETGFWTAPRLALARWVLASVPENAILIAQGDDDAVPMLVLQVAEGVRPDVTVVHKTWLRHPWYARFLAAENGLPLPEGLPEGAWASAGPSSFNDAPVADAVLDFWVMQVVGGDLGRPLVGSITLDPSTLASRSGGLVDNAAYTVPSTRDEFALESAERSIALLNGADFVGPRVSPQDRSTSRGAFPVDLAGIALFQSLQVAVSHAQAGDAEASENAYQRAVTFAADAGLREETFLITTARQWIDDALAGQQ